MSIKVESTCFGKAFIIDKRLDVSKDAAQLADIAEDASDFASIVSNSTQYKVEPGTYMIPVECIATYSELLGLSSYEEALQAIMYLRDHPEVEPDPDPLTGENAWTSAYDELQKRELIRRAGVDVPSLLPAGDDSGIAKTRSILGFQSSGISPMSAASFSASDYPVEQSDLEVINSMSDDIERCREAFLKSLNSEKDIDELKSKIEDDSGLPALPSVD